MFMKKVIVKIEYCSFSSIHLILYISLLTMESIESELHESSEPLGSRMKRYESESLSISYIEPYLPFIIRLDGNCFSKFTSGFKRPFDNIFLEAMVRTCSDLIEKFNAVTGYTHSDEISIIFQKACSKEDFDSETNDSTHIYKGRTSKLLSLTSSYCSVRFNFHLNQIINDPKFDTKKLSYDFIQKIKSCSAIFDSRIIVFPQEKSEIEIVNHMLWRSKYDCYRNCVSSYADFYVGKKKTFKKNSGQKIILLFEHGIDFETDVDVTYKYGMFVKKQLYKTSIEYTHKKTGKTEITSATRCKIIRFNMNVNPSDEKCRETITSKYMENNKLKVLMLDKKV
jgi:tRNA(His) guanylyltransferase